MSQRLSSENPVALITGGAVRVGRAIVKELAGAGCAIAITYRTSSQESAELVGELQAKRIKAIAIRADFSNPGAAADVRRDFLEHFNQLDLLVNNASEYGPDADDAAASSAQLRRFLAVNAEAPCALCREFAPMLRSTRGCVVNLLDVMAERPVAKLLNYSASKAALWNLTLGLAREMAPDVRVNGIAPGVVDWPVGFPEEKRQRYLRRVPLGRVGTPEEVAKAVRFLWKEASYMTGQILRLDGGRSIV